MRIVEHVICFLCGKCSLSHSLSLSFTTKKIHFGVVYCRFIMREPHSCARCVVSVSPLAPRPAAQCTLASISPPTTSENRMPHTARYTYTTSSLSLPLSLTLAFDLEEVYCTAHVSRWRQLLAS